MSDRDEKTLQGPVLHVSSFESLYMMQPNAQKVQYTPFMILAGQIALSKEFSIVASSASRGTSIAKLAENGIDTLFAQGSHNTIAAYMTRFKEIELGLVNHIDHDAYEEITSDISCTVHPDNEEGFLAMLSNTDQDDDDDDECDTDNMQIGDKEDYDQESDDDEDYEESDEDNEGEDNQTKSEE